MGEIDLKPENLLYENDRPDSKLMLVDFGYGAVHLSFSEINKANSFVEGRITLTFPRPLSIYLTLVTSISKVMDSDDQVLTTMCGSYGYVTMSGIQCIIVQLRYHKHGVIVLTLVLQIRCTRGVTS